MSRLFGIIIIIAFIVRIIGAIIEFVIEFVKEYSTFLIAGSLSILLMVIFYYIVSSKKKAKEIAKQEERKKEYQKKIDNNFEKFVDKYKTSLVEDINPKIIKNVEAKFIYVYTTDGDKYLNRFKVGETTRNPLHRVEEQDTTSNSSDLILVAYWHAGTTSDKTVHKHLERLGIKKVRKNREWFTFEGGEAQVKAVIPKIIAKANLINDARAAGLC